MKFAKLFAALGGCLLLVTLLVLPQVMEAARARRAPAWVNVPQGRSNVTFGKSYHNDTSAPLREMPQLPYTGKPQKEANKNPKIQHSHRDSHDPVVQTSETTAPSANMPGTTNNFDGVPFPGVACNCAPPDTDGEVGATQYVQIVNEGYQVFDKSTGASLLGPSGIESIWTGFGGVCQTGGQGDPIVLYDQISNRWLISQFAGGLTHE